MTQSSQYVHSLQGLEGYALAIIVSDSFHATLSAHTWIALYLSYFFVLPDSPIAT
jgi:hypothetical protein